MIRKFQSIVSRGVANKYAKNTGWMFVEQGVRAAAGLIVGAYVARYLGPSQFGLISYALAISSIFLGLSRLGMDSILVRELVNNPKHTSKIMGTAFTMMILASVTSFIGLIMVLLVTNTNPQILLLIAISMVSTLFQAFLVIDYYFQANIQAKISSIAKSGAVILTAVFKVYLVMCNASLIYFIWAYTLDSIVVSAVLLSIYIRKKEPLFVMSFDRQWVKSLFTSSLPMIISVVTTILLMRLDQLMIKNMLGDKELGIYSAATRLYEGWITLSWVFVISLLPIILKFKQENELKYQKNMIRLFAFVFWIAIVAAVVSGITGKWIIELTFGFAYSGASKCLTILMAGSAFAAVGNVTARYFNVEKMEKKIPIRIVVALLLNTLLNIILIPIFGIEGSAMATSICLICAHVLIDYTDPELKVLRKMKRLAIFNPISYSLTK